MGRHQSPQEIARTRYVIAESVLEGQVDLSGYPFRHLAVIAYPGSRTGIRLAKVTGLLAAVEVLTQWGWVLVNVTTNDSPEAFVAFLRRG